MQRPTPTHEPLDVLVVEDETIIRLDICALVAQAGHRVVGEAANGRDAVELARQTQPDLVLLDVRMPQMDGIEAARLMLAEREVAIVVLTAFAEDELVRQAADLGVYGYLVKPFRGPDLAAAITTAHAKAQQMQTAVAERDAAANALSARKTIERAKGLLMDRHGMSESEAFDRLRRASQASRQPMVEVAQAVIASSEL